MALNNAVIAANRPATGKIPEKRMFILRETSLALIGPLKEVFDDGWLRAEEAVAVLAAAALTLQAILSGAKYTEVTRELLETAFGTTRPMEEKRGDE